MAAAPGTIFNTWARASSSLAPCVEPGSMFGWIPSSKRSRRSRRRSTAGDWCVMNQVALTRRSTSSAATASMMASGAQSRSSVRTGSSAIVYRAADLGSCEVGALRLDVDGVERFARRHEQPVAARAAEADVGAGFRQPDHSDGRAVWRDHLYARARAAPDVAVHVRADAVGGRRRAVLAVHEELRQPLAVAQRLAVDVVDADVAARARVGDVQLPVVGREADSVRAALIVGDLLDLSRLRVDAVDRFLGLLLVLEPFVVAADAVGRIREPDAAVGMHGDVVRRVEPFAVEAIREHGLRPVVLVADDAAAAVLARDLPAFEVERVPVAVAGGIPEHRHASVFLGPPHLHVVRDVAPDQEPPDAVPRRALGPQRAEVQPANHRVVDDVAAEAGIEREDVGIWILNGILTVEIPRAGDRRHLLRRLRGEAGDAGRAGKSG